MSPLMGEAFSGQMVSYQRWVVGIARLAISRRLSAGQGVTNGKGNVAYFDGDNVEAPAGRIQKFDRADSRL